MTGPEFTFQEHAREKVRERFGPVPEAKMLKLCRKAWRSRQPVPEGFMNLKRYNGRIRPGSEYRFLMGYVFVFEVTGAEGAPGGVRKRLKTVLFCGKAKRVALAVAGGRDDGMKL